MIRAIIFDCYGVLTTEGWLPFKKKHFGQDAQLFEDATDLSKRLNSGHLDYPGFVKQAADLARVSYQSAARQIMGSKSNDELFEYIEQFLKPHYKIGLLSNAGSNNLAEMFSEKQVALFDGVALSYEIGTVKPDRAAYESILGTLQVMPSEAVFIDDQLRHCNGARDVGMRAIVYKDFDQMRQDLEKLLKQSE
jgi:HAD superfamily hydrolase (TIGR01509 family)